MNGLKVIENIVTRLRRIAEQAQCDCEICDAVTEAANEIERLRSALHQQNEYSLRLQNELERIRV
jgi:predicted RNase H-like nuclease (RuvC/YqgF family)